MTCTPRRTRPSECGSRGHNGASCHSFPRFPISPRLPSPAGKHWPVASPYPRRDPPAKASDRRPRFGLSDPSDGRERPPPHGEPSPRVAPRGNPFLSCPSLRPTGYRHSVSYPLLAPSSCLAPHPRRAHFLRLAPSTSCLIIPWVRAQTGNGYRQAPSLLLVPLRHFQRPDRQHRPDPGEGGRETRTGGEEGRKIGNPRGLNCSGFARVRLGDRGLGSGG